MSNYQKPHPPSGRHYPNKIYMPETSDKYLGHIDEPKYYNFSIKVRIIRVWFNQIFKRVGQHYVDDICLVLLDEIGQRIEAIAKAPHVSRKFRNLLQEGEVVVISNFLSFTPTHYYRVGYHKFSIEFQYNSIISKYNGSTNIPILGLDLHCFSELKSKSIAQHYIVDVIGVITNQSTIEDFNFINLNGHLFDGEKHVIVSLKDCNEDYIKVIILGDEFVDPILSYMKDLKNNEEGYIIIQFVGIVHLPCGDVYLRTISSKTKVIVGIDSPHIDDYVMWYLPMEIGDMPEAANNLE